LTRKKKEDIATTKTTLEEERRTSANERTNERTNERERERELFLRVCNREIVKIHITHQFFPSNIFIINSREKKERAHTFLSRNGRKTRDNDAARRRKQQ